MNGEVMTMATDFLLGFVCLGLGIHLLHARHMLIAGAAFFAMGFAALAGGAYHGLVGFLGEQVAGPMFRASLISIGVSNLLLVIAVLGITAPSQSRRPWIIGLATKLAAFLFWALPGNDFRAAIADYAATLAIIFWLVRSGPPILARPIRAGIFVSVAASVVQAARLAPFPGFNHNDLYHVIQIGAVVLIHRGFLRVHT